MATRAEWRSRSTPKTAKVQPRRPTPIPIVGEASSAAELVDLLKRAHLERLAAAEHDIDVDDRYVTTEEVRHGS